MHAVYVYYRVQPELAGDARQSVEHMLAALRAEDGITGRLLCKCDEPMLWMEVYEPVPDLAAFERLLMQSVARADLDRFLAPGSVRKLECFLG